MNTDSFFWKYKILWFFIAVALCLGLVYFYGKPIQEQISSYYHIFSDREQIKTLIAAYGAAAPLVFVAIQVLQVLFAPIPGEATGFIGGYLFGVVKGFIYSSIGLTTGSWLNFKIGRFLGERYVRKLIPTDKLKKFDFMLKRQGVIIIFIFFLFPGFPKDYLCLFLGVSNLPVKVFLILAALGRMPGTFMLSLQGALLFEKMYAVFGIIFGFCILLVGIAYFRREAVYRWVDKVNHRA